MEEMKELKVNAGLGIGDTDSLHDQMIVVDFKMVTFSLAGKDYAIDIMRVKEIAKAGNFTYVPNTSPFVLGVYNLRGDIIPIIDLRIFFNIPVPARKKNQPESMVIINVQDQTFGVVVDFIDKVVGVSSSTIQPPHPIFGDINIKYIHGVVENGGRLYILLDVDKIFASRQQKEEVKEDLTPVAASVVREPVKLQVGQSSENLDIKFIGDTLSAMGKFYISAVNENWVKERYLEWKDMRPSGNLQIQSENDAGEFLSSFLSPFTKRFWSEAYINAYYKMLPENTSSVINVWCIGCGQGYEAYSLAVLLRMRYPRAHIKIFANDSDLLAISNAPMLSVPDEVASGIYEPYITKTASGSLTFLKEIKDMILFEYHDCTHQNVVPDIDIIVARDVLSFMNPNVQRTMIEEFREKLKNSGLIILGHNEAMPKQDGWLRNSSGDIVIFTKE
ncbi:chemotaxis protein CheW [Treponema sp. OMZ 792]|uniref:CheR family methyltransferase n=1 Tax=unclassified Treponema TaxID=2638727 RepID=UPI0020A37E4E|nr:MULTISPECIES: CheR family methyltransferase [unclassified Treponema]UTC76228.1 chemotaxis protein CheW [Treponema sp. OMZ 792]UTC80229.1 chemotaxis protein CheW [Treponema sp. OMZ 798]